MASEDTAVEEDIVEDDSDVSELPEFSPKSEFSKARLAEEFVRKACDARSKEMREGYYNIKFDKFGNACRVWVEDSRKVFCSTVDALFNLLTPEIVGNKRAMNIVEIFETKKKEIKERYLYRERIKIVLPNGDTSWKETGRYYLPRIDEKLPIDDPKSPQSVKVIYVEGLWNKQVNAYWDEMVELYDNFFQELNLLIGTLNYFKPRVSF